MKKKYLRVLLLAIILGFLVSQTNILPNFAKNRSTAYAVGDLTIDWGVPSGQPIFEVNNFLPGQNQIREVVITNNATVVRPVGIRGRQTAELKDLADILDFRISEGGTDLYGGTAGGKTLADFFDESEGIDGIELFSVDPGQTRTINFTVQFSESAGNEFQNASVVFDIIIGIAIEVPEECRNIHFSGNPIFGTERRDVLNGTNGNDLIFAFEGNDVVNSSNGDDCLVGGSGNDILHGSNGRDVIFGDEGDDRIDGSNGDDLLFGGSGNDKIDASNGNDTIYGGAGNDVIDGGNGNDFVNAESGDDKLTGRNGSDTLIGGDGNDWIDGGLGVDTCQAEIKKNCEK